jgi:predicted hotdog family 3-hydroxylacyl-ACP dehydratase
MDTSDIRQFVPHAGLMCLLDRLLASGDTWLEAEVTIRPDSLFCNGECVGAWVGIEYMAQAIAAFGGVRARSQNQAVKIGFLVGTRKYQSEWPVFPVGSQLRIRVEQEYAADNGLSVFQCRLHCAQAEVASAAITVFQPEDPAAYLKGVEA